MNAMNLNKGGFFIIGAEGELITEKFSTMEDAENYLRHEAVEAATASGEPVTPEQLRGLAYVNRICRVERTVRVSPVLDAGGIDALLADA